MKLTVVVLALLISLSAVKNAVAQQQQSLGMPQGIGILQQSASSKSEFTFDHSMLVLASKLDPDNEDLRRVIAGVNGVSVHSYHYSRPWIYSPDAVNSVKEEYGAAG